MVYLESSQALRENCKCNRIVRRVNKSYATGGMPTRWRWRRASGCDFKNNRTIQLFSKEKNRTSQHADQKVVAEKRAVEGQL